MNRLSYLLKTGVLRTLNFGFTKPYPKLMDLALSSSYFVGNNRYKILTITAALSGMLILTLLASQEVNRVILGEDNQDTRRLQRFSKSQAPVHPSLLVSNK